MKFIKNSGLFITNSKINEVVDRIVYGYRPKQIILFGSYAYGKPNKDSDLDLFIIKKTDKKPPERTRDVLRLLRRSDVPVDVVVYTNDEFNYYNQSPYTLEYKILKKGKTIYMALTKQEIIKEWIAKGDQDLGTAKLVATQIPEYIDTICFHCHQASEKYLKAYLIELDIEFPKTHKLGNLLDLLSHKKEILSEYYEKAEFLEAYAVEIRYPFGIYVPTEVDTKTSIDYADFFRNWIISELKKN